MASRGAVPTSRRERRARRTSWYGPARPEFSGNNEARLLRGGDALFPEMTRAVARAHDEVWLATYIFHRDAAGEALIEALVAASLRGVRVRLVVDGFGSMASIPWLREATRGTTVALAVFRPIGRWWSWLQPGQLRRLHQKLCVVDSEHAYVGGINVIDDRIDLRHGLGDAPRLDFAVELRGPVVDPIEQAARAVWSRAWLGRDFGEELLAVVRSPEPIKRVRRLLRGLRMPRNRGKDRTDLPPVCAAFVLRDNLRQRRTIEHAYIEAIEHARTSVDLITPYFYPGQSFRRALREAAKRGVRVRLLLQGKVDYLLAGMAAHALYAELLGHGVQIYEYTAAWLHAKVAVVDGHWATVGSSNIDPLSLLLNLEANVIVLDEDFAADLEHEFELALADSVHIEKASGGGWRRVVSRATVAWVAYVYLRVAGSTGRY
jgi:cardiolipin synthase